MGQTTASTQVWTPDEGDLDYPDVYLATMAASIENGIGERLKLQEVAVGLKASVANNGFAIPATTPGVIPYTVSTEQGDFNNGFDFSAGTATVKTPGMYLATATLSTIGGTSGRGLKIQIFLKGSRVGGTETAQTDGIWGSTMTTVVLNCVAGDTIQAKGAITGAGALATSNNGESTHLSIAMVQAVPQ